MSGTVVNAKWPVDSVRLDILGSGRAVTIPTPLLVAIDEVFRAAVEEEEDLEVVMVDDENDLPAWEARLGHFWSSGATPWQAIAALADKLQWDGRKVCGRPGQ